MTEKGEAAYRWSVTRRAVFVIVGGYFGATLFAIALALLLPVPRADAVLFGTIFSFLVYAGIAIWAYARVRGGFRKSMAWLHTWTGLLLGWVLYAVFVTGTAAYYRNEITLWMSPEARATSAPSDALDRGLAELKARAAGSDRWSVSLPDERDPSLSIQWREKTNQGTSNRTMYWDASSEQFITPRATEGGAFLYRFHYNLHLPDRYGEWIVGVAAMLMLVAIISGVVTHRRFFKDFFVLRLKKGGQRAWLDAHNMTSVFALPFHLMITFTGLLSLMFVYLPWAQQVMYGDDTKTYSAEAFGNADIPKASGEAAGLASLATVIATSRDTWGSDRLGRVMINNAGDAAATFETRPNYAGQVSLDHRKVIANGATGEVVSNVQGFGPGVATRGVLIGLHVARFAQPTVRALFFLCGLAGCAMVATGLVLWNLKRRDPRIAQSRAERLVERLNIAAILGAPIAVAAYFLANRLLPAELPTRADWEIRWFFIAWALSVLHAFARQASRAWQEQLSVASLLFFAVPLVNALTTGRGLWQSLASGDVLFAAFDVVQLCLGAAFASTAFYLWRREHGSSLARGRASADQIGSAL
ncbi:PepSY-associated TM helix domain-containing protein [Steroidobacter sp.]|uniref:PepSY-associated TM helix domain-containing protein n=1 Tax=Steroidobacter sp. TaxID=1978227 RepID=UPI001A4466C9|nr:PepSY-associated TM helix domain-containing protein [Steroidobacter sp.]MBL8264972.1 PepSY domain-containing protein [Steroidobacter sp.]